MLAEVTGVVRQTAQVLINAQSLSDDIYLSFERAFASLPGRFGVTICRRPNPFLVQLTVQPGT